MIDFSDMAALIFDCDGTLLDTPPIYARAWAKGFQDTGQQMPREWFMERAGMSDHVLMDAFESDFKVKVPNRVKAIEAMRQEFFNNLSDLKEIRTIAQIARENKGKRRLAVASGGARIIVETCLKSTNLFDLFDEIITIEDVAKPKPAPDLFLKAAQRLNTDPDLCFVFEDTQSGLEAAHAAGMKCINVAHIIYP
ncbi:HAD family hydrolase [Gluconobacter cerinus]|uniref:HAD family hydrolase n=1 Tax=Gluconobacter cerinus TaxID=38307 RepID=UPI001B8B3948|nr:HAD family phosphatase [Gluconobacter cerinus]MBS1070065.1 HAD family phosphatase [Gluconobacter cerinus]